MNYSNTELSICQDENLEKEIITQFTPKRQASELLSQSYYRLGLDSKSQRVADCGTFLEFRKPLSFDSSAPFPAPTGAGTGGTSIDGWKLHNANFCRDRLCPMCSWRRSYKVFAQVSQIMDCIADDYIFLFLTLTVPNCSADELAQTIDNMQNGFRKFMRYKRIKTAVRGFFKALEVTRNRNNGTFHPHFHNIIAVNKNYFKSDKYIKRDEWLEFWRLAMKDPTITQVDIRRCKPKEEIQDGEKAVKALGAAVAEVAKYSVKSSDYLLPDDEETTDHIVFWLGSALASRRLCSFGGIFDEIRKKLNLDDAEDGDLIIVDGSELRPDVAVMVRKYGWSCGAYKLIEEHREVNVVMEVEENEKQ